MSGVYKKVNQVLLWILIANIGVAVMKLVIGKSTGSTSMVADGFHSLSDATSNIIGLIAIYFSSMPKDREHPYGHKKIEQIASMAIGIMLLTIAVKVIYTAFYNLETGVVISISNVSLVVMVVTLAINIFISTYERRKGEELENQVLISDSIHTRSDIFISLGVLLTLVCVKLGLPSIIDPIVSIGVSAFIINSGYEVLKSSARVLIDSAVVDIDRIEELVLEFNEVINVHNIRNRGSKSELYIDMHIMVEPFIGVERSHQLTHEIEEEIKSEISKNSHVIVHVEPFYRF
ncbi:MAG: cation diffusion facilitator family transporter [Clostridioides sp.]|nr:cation diffusion facilitator family transporter [Clostridioides sp.]